MLSGTLRFEEVTEADGGSHRVLTGDYESAVGRWAPPELPPGQSLATPKPLFRKLEPTVVEEELARLEKSLGESGG